jgi:hypothetical protein
LRSADAEEDPRRWQARAFRCWILTVLDRFGEALTAATEGIRSAQQARNDRAARRRGMPHTLQTKPSQWLGGSGGITGMIPRRGVL